MANYDGFSLLVYTEDTDDTAWCNWKTWSKSEASDSYYPPSKRQEQRGRTISMTNCTNWPEPGELNDDRRKCGCCLCNEICWCAGLEVDRCVLNTVVVCSTATARPTWLQNGMKSTTREGFLLQINVRSLWPTTAISGHDTPVSSFCWWSWRTKDDSSEETGGWDI